MMQPTPLEVKGREHIKVHSSKPTPQQKMALFTV